MDSIHTTVYTVIEWARRYIKTRLQSSSFDGEYKTTPIDYYQRHLVYLPNKITTMSTKCQLLEITRNKFVIFDYVNILLPDSTSTQEWPARANCGHCGRCAGSVGRYRRTGTRHNFILEPLVYKIRLQSTTHKVSKSPRRK